eukprot:241344-Amorphochlora_amoeboformis.AAC.1
MGQALKIFEQRLAPDDRRIAFAHQMMAMDCVFSNQNDKAVPHYENVREVLGERIVSLYKKIGVLSSQGCYLNVNALLPSATLMLIPIFLVFPTNTSYFHTLILLQLF